MFEAGFAISCIVVAIALGALLVELYRTNRRPAAQKAVYDDSATRTAERFDEINFVVTTDAGEVIVRPTDATQSCISLTFRSRQTFDNTSFGQFEEVFTTVAPGDWEIWMPSHEFDAHVVLTAPGLPRLNAAYVRNVVTRAMNRYARIAHA